MIKMNKKTLILIISILTVVILLISAKELTADSDSSGVGSVGESLGDATEFTQGFSGLGMLWSPDAEDSWRDSWPAWSQDLFDQGLFEGLLGGGFCYDMPSGTTGGDNNIAVGSDPASAAAWILAEQVRYWVTPEDLRYIYKIQFYVIAGSRGDAFDDTQVCEELNFQIVKKINGIESPLVENSLSPGVAYTFIVNEGAPAVTQLTALETDLLLATSTSDLLGQQICIKFTKMISQGCVQGHTTLSEENTVCSDIVLGEEYSYDYDCEGGFCDAFFNFQDDWEFTQPPATAAGAPTVPTTTTDPATGLPTNVPVISLD